MEDVVVNILFSSKNIIHTCISSSFVDTLAYVTFIYGPPDEHERNLCWQEVRRIARSINDSWLCVGDYNDILFQDEKLGGNPRAMRKLLNFQCFVADCELMDLGFNGYRFTWRNNREGDDLIEERLDRALGNINLREKFPQLQVFNIEPIGSDHHMLLVNCCYNKKRGAKLFRFETLWTAHPDYCAVVRRSWREETDNFSKMEQFLICLSNCRKTLSHWSKKEFPNNRKKIATLKDQLTSMRLSCRTGELLREMMDLKVEIEKYMDYEEEFWRQRSRIEWLKSGDKNTRFFHLSTIRRRQQNNILRLRDGRGRWVTEATEINSLISDFFSNIFKSVGQRPLDEALSCVNTNIDQQMNQLLMARVTREEIKAAAFNLGSTKAPGPDGFSGQFYHTSWDENR